jgi:hypothetical protein
LHRGSVIAEHPALSWRKRPSRLPVAAFGTPRPEREPQERKLYPGVSVRLQCLSRGGDPRVHARQLFEPFMLATVYASSDFHRN